MAELKISCEAIRQVEETCEKFHNDPGELISILHEVQGRLGYLPEPVQRVIADKLGIPAQGLTIVLMGDILMGFVVYPVNQALLQLDLVLVADREKLLDRNVLAK